MAPYRAIGLGRFTGASAIYPNEQGGLDAAMKKLVVRHESYVAPPAPATAVHAQFNVDFDHAESGLTQPSAPNNIQIVFSADWDGGDVEVTGITNEGCERVETIADPVGGGTVQGLYAFLKVTHIKNTGTRGAGTCDVQLGTSMGVMATRIFAFIKLVSNKVVEAMTAKSETYGTFTPNTAPDATKNFEVFYTVEETGNRADNEP